MTKPHAYYEAYLVLQCLSKTEYNLIPKSLLDEITSKMEKDDSIKIDPSIPLEKQKLSEKTYGILDKVINAIEKEYGKDAIDHPENVTVKEDIKKDADIEIDLSNNDFKPQADPKSSSKLQEENFKLQGIIETLKKENEKVGKAKELVLDYKGLVEKKDMEIEKLKEQVTKLQGDNADLYNQIQQVPRIFRKIFIKDDVKLLKWVMFERVE